MYSTRDPAPVMPQEENERPIQNQSDSYQLRQVLDNGEMLSLADRIKDNFPYCIQMYNTLLVTGKGLNTNFTHEIFVPKSHPDSHIIIRRILVGWKCMSIYCKEDEMPLLLEVMKGSHFLSLVKEDPVNIVLLSNYQIDSVLETLNELLQTQLIKTPDTCYAYITLQDSVLRCPAGFKVHRLGRAGVRKILGNSQSFKNVSLDIPYKLTENLPALGIYLAPEITEDTVVNLDSLSFADHNITPVAHVALSPSATMNYLWCDEKYRRLGLASLLVELLGRLNIAEGYFPHAVVIPKNDVAANLFNKLKGWKKTHCANRIFAPK